MSNTVSTIIPYGYFSTHAGLQFSNDGRFLTYAGMTMACRPPPANVYLYDFQTGNNLLVSQNFIATGAANTGSDSPGISPNGRFVAYRSLATNVVPLDFNGVADLFLYDVSNNSTMLLSVNGAGDSSANGLSLKPVFSTDGRTLFFQSWASDLSAADFNNEQRHFRARSHRPARDGFPARFDQFRVRFLCANDSRRHFQPQSGHQLVPGFGRILSGAIQDQSHRLRLADSARQRDFYRRHRLCQRPIARARPKILPHCLDSSMIMKTSDRLVIEENRRRRFHAG